MGIQADRVGIMGGTFDPPHIAHLIAAQSALEALGLGKVIFVPSSTSPDKTNAIVSEPRHRLRMIELATATNPHFEVSSLEIDRGGISYTIETVRTMREANPGAEFFLIIGADNFRGFETWKEYRALMELTSLAVLARPGQEIKGIRPDVLAHAALLHTPLLEISASSIRARVRDGLSIQYMVTPEVGAYIAENKLYT